jgi:hypothetical protein
LNRRIVVRDDQTSFRFKVQLDAGGRIRLLLHAKDKNHGGLFSQGELRILHRRRGDHAAGKRIQRATSNFHGKTLDVNQSVLFYSIIHSKTPK